MSISPLIEIDLNNPIPSESVNVGDAGLDAVSSATDAPSDVGADVPAVSSAPSDVGADVPSDVGEDVPSDVDIDVGTDASSSQLDDDDLAIINTNEGDDFFRSDNDTDDNIEDALSDFLLEDMVVTDLVEYEVVLKRDTEVVEADYIQIEDYIDEVTRSKKGYISAKRKNIIQKEADNFIMLKSITIGRNQEDNTFFVKRKTDNYNPLLENILKQDYNNKRFIPIVHDSIKLYGEPTQTETTLTLVTELPTNEGTYDEKYFMKNFDEELNELYQLNIRYNEFNSQSYDYYNKLADINTLIQPEFPFTNITSGYVKTMVNDTFVLRNCSEDSPCSLFSKGDIKVVKYDSKKLIGTVNNYDIKNNIIVVEKGQQHNIVGFLSIPTRYLFKLNNFQCALNINETANNYYTDSIKQILNEYEKEIKISYINTATSIDFDLKDLDIKNDIHLLLLPENQILEDLDEIYKHLNHIFTNNSHTDIVDLFTHYANNNIMNLNYTIKELNIFLSTFNLELNDLTYDVWNQIKGLIQNSIDSINHIPDDCSCQSFWWV
mgnify:CR=1 FL=1